MRRRFLPGAKRGLRGEHGAVAVEFAIIIPLFIFLVLGGMDLAHMFYIEHIVATASREGARYGAKYTGSPPADPSPTQISTYVTSTVVPPLDGLVVQDPVYTNVPGPPAYRIVTVTVTAHKHWWILGTFNFYGWEPFPNPRTVTGKTSMKVEF
jgi:Flp pilus assembly protein TadG